MPINVSPEGAPVFGWWQTLTGQEIRCPGVLQGRQAHTIATLYSREDLEITVAYVKRQIADNEAVGRRGLSARSMTWQNFFGDEEACEKFQANWNLARATASRKKAVPAPPQPVAVPADDKWQAGSAAMAELKARLRRGV